MAKPTSQKQTMAIPVWASTLAETCAAFLARIEPASSSRKPDCMKKIRAKQMAPQHTATTVARRENWSCETGGASARAAASEEIMARMGAIGRGRGQAMGCLRRWPGGRRRRAVLNPSDGPGEIPSRERGPVPHRIVRAPAAGTGGVDARGRGEAARGRRGRALADGAAV